MPKRNQPKKKPKSRWWTPAPLGLWGAYFAIKAVLHLQDMLRMQFWLNTAFLAYLLLPPPAALRGKRWGRPVKAGVDTVLALLLLWGDSWRPALTLAVSSMVRLDPPSLAFAVELAANLLLSWTVLGIVVFLAAYRRWSPRVFLTPLVCLLLVLVGLKNWSSESVGSMETPLRAFYLDELSKRESFPTAEERKGLPDFDVYFLHICSLGWDDLKTVGLSRHPFFYRDLDLLFTRFNSVATHSVASALRLFRAPCGQLPHAALYRRLGHKDCYLFDSLRDAGFKTYTAYAHDGEYGNMKRLVKKYGHGDDGLLPDSLPPYQRNFDGRPLYQPYAFLDQVRRRREAEAAPRAALYVNLATLHSGAHRIGAKGWWRQSREQRFRELFEDLAADLRRFMQDLESSKRKAVIFFLPAHGLGLRGSSVQAEDLRDIPMPYLTLVPAGVRLVGVKKSDRRARVIDTPVGNLAVATILNRLLRSGGAVWSDGEAASRVLAAVPETPYVAENRGQVAMEKGEEILFRGKGRSWRRMPKDVGVQGRDIPTIP